MAHKLNRTKTYEFSRVDHLGPLATRQLRAAESFIQARADSLPNTIQITVNGQEVTLFGYADLAFYLRVRPPDTVDMYLVVDGRNLPSWFTSPSGTWFEKLDLSDE